MGIELTPFAPEGRVTRSAVNRQLETLWNATRVTDDTAVFLGMDPNAKPTVSEGLIAAVLSAGNACRVNVTVTVGGKAAKAGIQIEGIKAPNGGICSTDSTGKCVGLTSSATTRVATAGYVDLPAVAKSVATPAQGTVNVTLALAAPVNLTVKTYNSSTTVKFSPYVTGVDVSCVGGGGGGGGARPNYEAAAGGGGGGGHISNVYNTPFQPNTPYRILVGSGGSAGTVAEFEGIATAGGSGGMSSFLTASALGGEGGAKGEKSYGAGGAGNGNGGKSNTAGGNSTEGFIFGSSAYGGAGGGGGSGAYYISGAVQALGGTPYGGKGASNDGAQVNHATAATGVGGGGGGGCATNKRDGSNYTALVGKASAGYHGAVYVRYRVSAI